VLSSLENLAIKVEHRKHVLEAVLVINSKLLGSLFAAYFVLLNLSIIYSGDIIPRVDMDSVNAHFCASW
jgi:hypothetical protein